jgi:hypothetical protein
MEIGLPFSMERDISKSSNSSAYYSYTSSIFLGSSSVNLISLTGEGTTVITGLVGYYLFTGTG